MEAAFAALWDLMVKVQDELYSLRGRVADLKNEVHGLRTDLRTDLPSLSGRVTDLKKEVYDLRIDLFIRS